MIETESTVWPVQPALVARIEAAIRTFRAADPFLPIHVIVSNHVLGPLLITAPRVHFTVLVGSAVLSLPARGETWVTVNRSLLDVDNVRRAH